jgi:hypothetical protein
MKINQGLPYGNGEYLKSISLFEPVFLTNARSLRFHGVKYRIIRISG